MEKAYHEIILNKNKIPAMIEIVDQKYYQNMIDNHTFIPVHWHRSLEISYIENASVILQIASSEQIIQNDFTLINSGEVHSLKVKELYDNPKAIIVVISYDFIKEYIPDFDEMKFDLSLEENHDDLKEIYQRLEKYKINQDEYSSLSLTSCILEILYLLVKNYSIKQISNKSNYTVQQVKHVLDYIHNHYQEDLTLSNVSSVAHLSKEHFSRQFSLCVGKGFKEYLTQYRLYKAYDDVIHSNKTIQDIAYFHGFSNVKSFIHAFSECYHETPLRYRTLYLESNNSNK